jgi:hypothetical protein
MWHLIPRLATALTGRTAREVGAIAGHYGRLVRAQNALCGAGTYLIAAYGACAKARPSTRWGWTIKSAKKCLALSSGWYGCYQHRRDRMRLSSPSNVIRSLVTGGGAPSSHRRPTLSSARPFLSSQSWAGPPDEGYPALEGRGRSRRGLASETPAESQHAVLELASFLNA